MKKNIVTKQIQDIKIKFKILASKERLHIVIKCLDKEGYATIYPLLYSDHVSLYVRDPKELAVNTDAVYLKDLDGFNTVIKGLHNLELEPQGSCSFQIGFKGKIA